MSGKIHSMISTIINERAKGNPSLESSTRTKLILKGIDPSNFSEKSEDDPVIIEKLLKVASDMGITLKV